MAQVVDGPDGLVGSTPSVLDEDHVTYGGVDGGPVDRAVADQARAMLWAGRTARVDIGGEGDGCPQRLSVLFHGRASRPRLLVFGAVDFAAALSQAGRCLGYRVTVCDARPVFATAARFPYADEVVVDWPHRYLERTEVDERTAVCASPTRPSSTPRCCAWHSACPSVTWGPWAPGAPMTSACASCAKRA